MQLPPLDVLLTWPQPNYTNPSEVRGPTILILTLIFLPLVVILVALRTYTRLRLSKSFGPDDIAILAAMFPTIACAVVILIAVQSYGWDRHVWDVPPEEFEVGLKLVIVVEVLFGFACTLTKLSMLLLILRVLASGSVILRRLSISVMVVVFLENLIFATVVVNTCSPVSDYWTLSFQHQNCINEAAHLLTGGIINSITDFCVVLIPIPIVMKLKLPLRQRIYCALLFGAGFVICIAGAVRIGYTYTLNTTYDKTWLAYPTWISGTIEMYLGIIATSIPAIKPLVSLYFPRMLGSASSRNQTSTSGHLRSFEPQSQHERNDSKTPFSDHAAIELSPSSSSSGPLTSDVEKGLSFPHKSKTSPLPPVVSSFSTYRKSIKGGRKSIREKGISRPVAAWKNSEPIPSSQHDLIHDTSKQSRSSFDNTFEIEERAVDSGSSHDNGS